MPNNMYRIDIYTDNNYSFFDDYDISIKSHPDYGDYLQARVDITEKKRLLKQLSKRKIRYRCYEDRWERSSDYRKEFFKAYKPPYRCRYCNKYLKKEYMVIDHIVPVAKVKKSTNARMLLYIRNISDVNDVRNLAPSCKRCNDKKGMKLGIWWFKGIFGKYKAYWVLRNIFYILFLSFSLLLIFHLIGK